MKETFVLGVDAAWTAHNPSGVALFKCFEKEDKKPQLIKVARSYEEFCCNDKIVWTEPVEGTAPDFEGLLKYCENQGWKVDLISLDIPLSPHPIVGRRLADNNISIAYGAYGAGTHSPSVERPGQISRDIYEQLSHCDFYWAGNAEYRSPAFIEGYPHTAIIELFDYPYRVPYKVENRSKY